MSAQAAESGASGDSEWSRLAEIVRVHENLTTRGQEAYFGAVAKFAGDLTRELDKIQAAEGGPDDLTREHVGEAKAAIEASVVARVANSHASGQLEEKRHDGRLLGALLLSAGTLTAGAVGAQPNLVIQVVGYVATASLSIAGYIFTWRNRGSRK